MLLEQHLRGKLWPLVFTVTWHCTYKQLLEQEELYFSIHCADRCCSTASACLMASALQADRNTDDMFLGHGHDSDCSVFCEQAWDSQSYLQKFLLQGYKYAISVFPHFPCCYSYFSWGLWRSALEIGVPQPQSCAELVCGTRKLAVPCKAVTFRPLSYPDGCVSESGLLKPVL